MNRRRGFGGWDGQLTVLSIGQLVGWGILFYSPLVAVAHIARDTGWGLGATTALLSVSLTVAAIAGIGVGRLFDHIPARFIMSVGAIIGAVGLVGLAVSSHLWQFGAALAVVGVAQSALLYQAAFTVATKTYHRRRQMALTVITIAGGLSSAVFAPLVVWLLGMAGWRAVFFLLAAAMVAMVPLYWWGLKRTPVVSEAITLPRESVGVRGALAQGRFWWLEVTMVVTTLAIFSATFLAIPIAEEKGLSDIDAAWVFAAIGFGQVFGRLAFLAVDMFAYPRLILAGFSLAAGVSLGLFSLLPGSLAGLVVVGIVVGALRGGHTLILATAVSSRWGATHYGAINGIFQAPLSVALALSPAVGSAVALGLGSYSAMALVMGVVIFLSAPLARFT